MGELILHPTSTAQWYELVNEAELQFGSHLTTDLENYLVLILEKYSRKPDLVSSVLAFDFLESLETFGQTRLEKLRDVGDKCLIFSGFFPGRADRKRVTLSYFVELGQRAYNYLSSLQKQNLTIQLYAELRDYFVYLMDVLFSVRELSGVQAPLSLVQAEDLWRKTGSRYALNIIKRHNKQVIITKQACYIKSH